MSSRLCVKNLPKGADERRLREVFSKKGEVTDAKPARKIGDPDAPRPWSHHSLKKPENDSKGKTKAGVVNAPPKGSKGQGKSADVRDSKGSVANDPKFQEFLEVMQPRSKAKMWANDAAGTLPDDSDEEMADDSSSEDASEKLQTKSKQDNDMTDMDFFKSKIKKNWSDSESDDEDSGDQSNATNDCERSSDESSDADENSQLVVPKGKEDDEAALVTDEKLALETGRLFICIFHMQLRSEEELVELCSQYGDVEQAHIVVNKTTKLSTGRGYVLFRLPDSAVRALDELDNSSFQGRLLRVQAAKPLNNKKFESNHATVEKKLSLKEQKLEQKKSSEVSGDMRAWNSFYMRQDTIWFSFRFDLVVENIARKNGISKTELLDREAGDLAVRIALGETHVISETKKYLSRSGVNVSAVEEGKIPSTPLDTLLYSAPVDEDEKNAIGERIVTKAIVEQTVEGVSAEEIDPDRVEVKKHVKNGKNVSMGFGFVEFDSVETATSVCKDLQGTVLDGHALILQLCHVRKDGRSAKKNDKDRSSTKLLVRNVAFEATEKDLRQLFSPFGQVSALFWLFN
ncbi:hypothetical protein PR202_ga19087 [Eleusine coracana subsp. coracana]|uniref:RRM domain-containing protein n=1 Tax=Eleusine coracana subsp. coracana TaxID=191504 RepID=A0AAV5CU90_ELECO|nr:hypothetical protein PR202_ga19087 [Eleusine coracana subsp. coracana]